MLGGTIVAWFLSSQEDIAEQTKSNGSEFMFSTFSMLTEKKILLLLPLLVYSGLQQAFIWGDFTENIVTPVLGVSLIGGVMAAYGAADAGGSLLAGRLSSGLASMSNIIYFGGISQLIVLVWIFLMKSYGSIMSGYLNIFGQAIIWGFGDASFNTQISSLLGTLFPGQTEGAFAQWKIWQSAATSLIFFITSSTTLSARIVLLLFMLPISLLAFSALRFMIIRKELIQNESVTCQS
ncbi:hypothetical protein KP509_02G094400 [Ceratopteris richardii]|nr:hypothetical protein KP509_02G094400 [Ceratopteris richardii]